MKSRVLTAIGISPIVLGAFFCVSQWPIILLGLFCAVVGTLELEKLLGQRVWPGAVVFSSLLMWTYFHLGSSSLPPVVNSSQSSVLGSLSLLGLISGVVSTYAISKSVKGASLYLCSLWYITPLWCLIYLHSLVRSHDAWHLANPMLMAVVPLWAGDTIAIFAGKLFGKRLLAPSISPKKTVEGAIGNLLACIGMAYLLAAPLGYPTFIGLGCGCLAGIFGQMGDLFESYVKRQAGVKDSGYLLPGHGGLLDRLDSIFFTAPLVMTVVMLMGFPLGLNG